MCLAIPIFIAALVGLGVPLGLAVVITLVAAFLSSQAPSGSYSNLRDPDEDRE